MSSYTLPRKETLVLQVCNISIAYSGNYILKDMTFSLHSGRKLIILGPNGCGKTTLLKAIASLIPISSGTVLVNGKPAEGQGIAYMKQSWPQNEFPISVNEVVEMSAKNSDLAKKALDAVGCSRFGERNFFSLSGGERQKVSFARCLAQDSNLLLIDEPTSFLDIQSQENLTSLLKDFDFREKTVLLVTHDEQLVSQLGWPTLAMEEKNGVSKCSN